jgi:hypothetical protein
MLVSISSVAAFFVKAGGLDSMMSRVRRERTIAREVSAPPPGTPLMVSLGIGVDRSFGIGVAEHSGIYLGNSQVAELNGNGQILSVSLSEFVNGAEGDPLNTRNGTCIFAACDETTDEIRFHGQAALNAKAFMDNEVSIDYNVFGNNCHMFTASCLLGGMIQKLSKVDWFERGTFSIVNLEFIIEQVLNDGKRIGWRRVRNHMSGFDYLLAPEKRIRLYKEGKIELPQT